MKLNFKKALAHRIRSFEAEKDSHEYMHPQRDWMLILGSAVLIFLGGVSYSALDFYAQFVMQPDESPTENNVIRYRDAAILELAKSYDEEEKVFTALRADMPDAPEPIVIIATTTEEVTSEEDVPLADTDTPLYTETAPTLSP